MLSAAEGGDIVHVFEPHSGKLPPVVPYLRSLLERWRFMVALARSELRAANFDTVAGQLWTVLDPLIQAGIYFVLIGIVRGGERSSTERLTLLIGSLFLFMFTRASLQGGARSIVSGGKLILNTSFPRALLPATAVLKALFELAPSMTIYAVIHLLAGRPIGAGILVMPFLLTVHAVFNLGIALGVATATVYIRDTANMVSHAVRLWMYMTPVLYPVSDLEGLVGRVLSWNPLYPLFASYQEVMLGNVPSIGLLAASVAWSAVALIGGGYLFLTRERGFALRI